MLAATLDQLRKVRPNADSRAADHLGSDRLWRRVLDVLSSDDMDVILAHFEDQDGKEIGVIWRHSPDRSPVPLNLGPLPLAIAPAAHLSGPLA